MLTAAASMLVGWSWPHPGLSAKLPALVAVMAVVVVAWQIRLLLRGHRSLTVAGLSVQAGILIAAIALTTQNLAAGTVGIGLPTAIIAGWGRLANAGPATTPAARSVEHPRLDAHDAEGTSAAELTDIGSEQPALVAARTLASQHQITPVVVTVGTIVVVLAALSTRGGIVLGLPILAAIFVPLERLWPLRYRRVLRRGWRTDLVHYLVNGAALKVGLIAAVTVTGGVLHALVPPPVRIAIAASPGWVQIVAGLAISAVGDYAGHRAAHEIPLLWRFHRVHHSIREMDWLAANHLHPIDETFIRSAAVLPLYALGFGQVSLGAFVLLITLQAVFIHANVNVKLGPLRWLTATPQFHHWHHARDPRARNSNFAGEFPILDAVFGTLYLPIDRWPTSYGLDEPEPDGYLRQLAWPLRARCAAAKPHSDA
ncbi:sterol desaturase family protein [Mycobacterium camsae]|uniref:sterol desaturase family protein n=1 Tax=Mycobacterium gordonae TaxID=1778 RepID=UPI00197F0CC8|nr:sterol desaturase family protein [Mycobacterium gordonae]